MKKYLFWTKALLGESVIFIFSCFLPLFQKIDLKWKSSSYKKQRPILLIHGYLHNSYDWFYHGRRLKKQGLGPIFTLNLGDSFSSIHSHAKRVEEKVKQIANETNTQELILIGHSMGGVVASYFALNIAKENTITDIVTIASPLRGTFMANFGFGLSAKEMKKNSEFILKLKEKIEKENDINFYHIATITDQLVRPYDSALIGKNINREYIVNGIGHASLLYSKKVSDKIINWLLESSRGSNFDVISSD